MGHHKKVIVVGDFNLHVDVAENSDSAAFMDVLELFGHRIMLTFQLTHQVIP